MDGPVLGDLPTTPVKLITKVTFTQDVAFLNIHLVVWQFWGRAAEASLTEKSGRFFIEPQNILA
jgi:hypothetical protein